MRAFFRAAAAASMAMCMGGNAVAQQKSVEELGAAITGLLRLAQQNKAGAAASCYTGASDITTGAGVADSVYIGDVFGDVFNAGISAGELEDGDTGSIEILQDISRLGILIVGDTAIVRQSRASGVDYSDIGAVYDPTPREGYPKGVIALDMVAFSEVKEVLRGLIANGFETNGQIALIPDPGYSQTPVAIRYLNIGEPGVDSWRPCTFNPDAPAP